MAKLVSSFWLLLIFLHSLVFFSSSMAEEDEDRASSSIVFATLGRANYAFDIFTLPTFPPNLNHHDIKKTELKITDGKSVNFNGFFASPTSSPSILSFLSNQSLLNSPSSSSPSLQLLVYVTERGGSSNIYLDAYYDEFLTKIGNPSSSRLRSALEETFPTRVQIPLLQEEQSNIKSSSKIVSMKDRPSISGEFLIYVSTHENPQEPRKSWAAVYSTHLKKGETRRLTPTGVADFSPAVSPSGIWTAVASSGEKGWDGEIEDLNTHIYIFRTSDGSNRIKVVDHGGWPCWIDDFTFYFHRSSDDGWWSVYKATLPPLLTHKKKRTIQTDSVRIERVTPPGLHAFTPAVSVKNKRFIAVATRRPTSDFRHIELFDLTTNQFVELTSTVSPKTHHFNPFFSFDGTQIGYHRCRGSGNGEEKKQILLENIQSPSREISLFRIDGSFPSFSPNGDHIAYAAFPGLYVVNRDGSGKREIFSGAAFSTAWDWKRKGVVYTSTGPTFASERTQVDVISVTIDDDDEENGSEMDGIASNTLISSSKSSVKKLTTGGQNNAFPSPSPDGKWVVFRSGRSGHKNLYVMDALEGEKGGIYRLTEGPWTDTMCNWSPNGEWIAFASDRENPGGGSYEIFFIHPNGTGLKKVLQSGEGGRTNHPWFSPGSDHLVFTTDYAAVSAEPIANSHHYQPYGDIFIARSDGSEIQRMTHNSYEDGTPAWGPTFMKPVDVVEWSSSGSPCSFDDCHWLRQSTPNTALGLVPPKYSC